MSSSRFPPSGFEPSRRGTTLVPITDGPRPDPIPGGIDDPGDPGRWSNGARPDLVEQLIQAEAADSHLCECPVCKTPCRRADARCGRCWAPLAPYTPPGRVVG